MQPLFGDAPVRPRQRAAALSAAVAIHPDTGASSARPARPPLAPISPGRLAPPDTATHHAGATTGTLVTDDTQLAAYGIPIVAA
jgi:hypothetical protein